MTEPTRKTPRTADDVYPDPDTTPPGPAGWRVMIFGAIGVAILASVISAFSLLFAPVPKGTPTPRVTPTDRILGVAPTETPTRNPTQP